MNGVKYTIVTFDMAASSVLINAFAICRFGSLPPSSADDDGIQILKATSAVRYDCTTSPTNSFECELLWYEIQSPEWICVNIVKGGG